MAYYKDMLEAAVEYELEKQLADEEYWYYRFLQETEQSHKIIKTAFTHV